MSARWVHLVTVGASIARNALIRGVPTLREAGISSLKGLEEALDAGTVGMEALSQELLNLVLEDPEPMSAELNTCLGIIREGSERGRLQLVYLFHTDTWVGRLCAKVLQGFFGVVSRRDFNGRVACQEPIEVEGLGSPEKFREGLANLLEKIASHISAYKRVGDTVFVHATGGFKPESAMALLAANLPGLGAPVFYIHEHFGEVVRIPATPISPRMLRSFEDLMDWVLHLRRVPRTQLNGVFGSAAVDEAVRLGWLREENGYVEPSAMGELVWRKLHRILRRLRE